MQHIVDLLNLALLAGCTIVLVLMFQANRAARVSAPSTALAKFRLLSKLSCGVAVGWILIILLGGKSVWLNGLCAIMYGWLSYSFRQSALRIEALLEAAKNMPAEDGGQEGGQDNQPPSS